MRAHAGADVLETFTVLAATGGAETGKIVLRRFHVAGAVAIAEAERPGLEQHLIKGIIPTYAQRFAEAHVFARDHAKAWVEARVAAFEVRQQAAGRDAGRHAIAAGGFDRRQVGGSRRDWGGKHGKKEKRSDAASHGTPTLSSPLCPRLEGARGFSIPLIGP